ncbi:MAG: transketolase [Rickettsiales bacterium]|nr:transketolase [Rickettsiales bacterium]
MTKNYQALANNIRGLTIDAVEKAASGHPGMPMGMADVATILFHNHLKFNPKDPSWFDRDRFVLSTGHGSMLIYSLLYLTGYEDITLEDIKNFRQLDAKTAGHPEVELLKGVETTTGPLGQGFANAVGMALSEKILRARFGADLIDHHTYTIVGDGCLMEGISHEVISFAGHHKLNKLIVLFDDNGITIDGSVDISCSDDQLARVRASGWNAVAIDGHDTRQINSAIADAKLSDKPTLIACKTEIAFGSPNKAGSSASHGAPLGADEVVKTKDKLGISQKEFYVPSEDLAEWRGVIDRSLPEYYRWVKNYTNHAKKGLLDKYINNDFYADITAKFAEFKSEISKQAPVMATRQASGKVIDFMSRQLPNLIGGSADLTGSNNTKASDMKPITPEDASGNYIYYGIREFGMSAIMNGMALHGGMVPFSGTFLVFTDYCRPAIRLSALMQQQVIYVMTHDSIGLGSDGPTHQPIEHIASLRAIPNLKVFRPCDIIETLESWQYALAHKTGPSLLCLTRQKTEFVRSEDSKENKVALGAYVLSNPAKADAVIIATGSEVGLALSVQRELEVLGINLRVVSMPSMELFFEQDLEYRDSVLGSDLPIFAVEAACSFGWHKIIGNKGEFFGVDDFGISADAEDIYNRFGLTTDNLVTKIKEALA